MSPRRFYSLLLAPILLIPMLPTLSSPVPSQPSDPPQATYAALGPGPDQKAFKKVLDSLPPRFRSQQSKWVVREYDGPAWQEAVKAYHCMDNDAVEGWTLPDMHVILIRQNQPAPPVSIFWHEVGHALFWPNLTQKEQNQWEVIYLSDCARGKYTTEYASENKEEAFCECLRLFETDRTALNYFTDQRAFFEAILKRSAN